MISCSISGQIMCNLWRRQIVGFNLSYDHLSLGRQLKSSQSALKWLWICSELLHRYSNPLLLLCMISYWLFQRQIPWYTTFGTNDWLSLARVLKTSETWLLIFCNLDNSVNNIQLYLLKSRSKELRGHCHWSLWCWSLMRSGAVVLKRWSGHCWWSLWFFRWFSKSAAFSNCNNGYYSVHH